MLNRGRKKEEFQSTKISIVVMTKSELHSKKRKRPRNRGPNKDDKPSNNNDNHNNSRYEEHEIPSGSAKRRKLKELFNSKPSSFLEKAYPSFVLLNSLHPAPLIWSFSFINFEFHCGLNLNGVLDCCRCERGWLEGISGWLTRNSTLARMYDFVLQLFCFVGLFCVFFLGGCSWAESLVASFVLTLIRYLDFEFRTWNLDIGDSLWCP